MSHRAAVGVSDPSHHGKRGQGWPRSQGRPVRLLMLLLVVVALVLGLLTFRPSLDTGGDNVEYLILARSLATGHGYTVLSAPLPHPETQRTPGYPLFLAGFMWLFGEQLWLLKATSLLLLAACAGLSFRLLRCQAGSTLSLSLLGAWLFVWNLEILKLASVTGSEMLYTLLTLVALLATMRYVGRDDKTLRDSPYCVNAGHRERWVWLAVMVLAAVGAVYVRPNGVTLVPALAAYLVLQRQWRAVAIGLVAGAVLLLPLVAMQRRAMEQGPTYMSYMTVAEDDEAGDSKVQSAADLARRTWRTAAAQTLNLGQLLVVRPAEFALRPRPVVGEPAEKRMVRASRPPAGQETTGYKPADVPGRTPYSPKRLARHASRYVLGIIALLGFVTSWRGRGSIMHWYVLMNVVLLLASPFPRGRYLLPMLPLWAWFLGMAVIVAARRLPHRRVRRQVSGGVLAVVVAAAMGFTLIGAAQQAIFNWETRGLGWHAPERYAMDGSDFVNYARAAEWLTRETSAQAVLVARKPYNLYWITGRRATWKPLWIDAPGRLRESLYHEAQFGPLYIVQDGFVDRFHGDITQRNLVPALARYRQEVERVKAWAGPETVVWRLKADQAVPTSAGKP